MARTGRGRLTWVTALTVASLLLGSGAMSALAEGRGGGGDRHGGGDHGNAEHAQSVSTAQTGRHDGEGADDHAVVHVAGPQQPLPENTGGDRGNGGGHGNDGGHGHENHATTATTTTTTVMSRGDDDDHGAGVQRKDDEDQNEDVNRQEVNEDEDDLVTPEVEETEEVRPGLGCGDDNHVHSGAPGNPGLMCKKDDDDNGAMNDDDDAGAQTEAVTVDDNSTDD